MEPDNDESQEDLKRLDELLNKMTKAGFLKAPGYTKNIGAATLTERGLKVALAIKDVEDAIGPLEPFDRLGLWNFFRLSKFSTDDGSPFK